MDYLAVFATTFGIFMAFGYYPQALKMFKTRSVTDISPLSFSVFFIGNITWEAYGIKAGVLPLVISSLFGIVGSGLVLILYFVYRKK